MGRDTGSFLSMMKMRYYGVGWATWTPPWRGKIRWTPPTHHPLQWLFLSMTKKRDFLLGRATWGQGLPLEEVKSIRRVKCELSRTQTAPH
jgi:hypothetical protein